VAVAGPAVGKLLDHRPRSRWGVAGIGAHEDEPDDQIIRADTQGPFDRFVVGGFTCTPEGAQPLSKRGEHEAVSRAAGGDDLLNDRNLSRIDRIAS